MSITNKKGINVTSGFKLISGQPIDARFVVEDETELESLITNGAVYEGLHVWVKSLGKEKVWDGTEFTEIQAIGGNTGSSSSEAIVEVDKLPDVDSNQSTIYKIIKKEKKCVLYYNGQILADLLSNTMGTSIAVNVYVVDELPTENIKEFTPNTPELNFYIYNNELHANGSGSWQSLDEIFSFLNGPLSLSVNSFEIIEDINQMTNSNILYALFIEKIISSKYYNSNGKKYIEFSTSENPIAIKTVEELPETQMVEKLGTELPTDGSIPNQIYFNLEATDEDIIPILQELNYNVGSGKYDGQHMNQHSVTIVNNITDFDFDSEHSTQYINIYWYPIGPNQINGIYLIGLYGLSGGAPSGDAKRIIWASKGTVDAVNNSGNYASYKDGWQDWVIEAKGILNIGGSDQYLTDNARYFIPLLKDIISSKPFEEKKYPNPDLNDQPIYKISPSPKEIINPENGFRMYFNGEDVSVRLSDDNGSEVDVRFYIEEDFPTENIKQVWIDGENGNPTILNFYLINNEIYGAQQDSNGSWNFDKDTWLLYVFGTAQYKFVNSLDGANESNILYVVVPNENCVFENPKYFILDKTTGHKLELGSGGGTQSEVIVEVDKLPYKLEPTTVPELGLVEKVYFNTKVDPIEVVKILETLQYYDLSSVGVSFPSAVVFTSADLSTVVLVANFSGDSYKSYSIIYQSSDGSEIIYEYSDSSGETSVADNWMGIENININVENMLGYLGPQFGVANQNEKLKNIISTTPFENWDNININDKVIYKVQNQTNGEYEQPKYVLLDKNTKTQLPISSQEDIKNLIDEKTIIITKEITYFEDINTKQMEWITFTEDEKKIIFDSSKKVAIKIKEKSSYSSETDTYRTPKEIWLSKSSYYKNVPLGLGSSTSSNIIQFMSISPELLKKETVSSSAGFVTDVGVYVLYVYDYNDNDDKLYYYKLPVGVGSVNFTKDWFVELPSSGVGGEWASPYERTKLATITVSDTNGEHNYYIYQHQRMIYKRFDYPINGTYSTTISTSELDKIKESRVNYYYHIREQNGTVSNTTTAEIKWWYLYFVNQSEIYANGNRISWKATFMDNSKSRELEVDLLEGTLTYKVLSV